ncbi:MAG TPA: endolytic transglycosylase MltG [Candidatus Dormibacteraeota bacterium]|nr:endolytic transglycosylase MltG [Candidatus Dormibacteraeota bacterium]
MKIFLTLLLILLLAAGAAGAYLWYGIQEPYQGFGKDGVFVTIPHGSSSRAAAHILEKNGVIRSAIAFEVYARRHPKRSLQAGEYFFDHATAGKEVFWKLAHGEVYVLPFTVREGETMFDIAHELEAAKFLTADEFLKAARDASSIKDLAPYAKTLEGFLFPATYQLPRHTVATDLVANMVQKFREQWRIIAASDPAPASVARPTISTVTLASLVERETPKPDERPLVAGVFENRLHKGMLLQCDPTVIYAMEQAGTYKGTLAGKDLHFDSPYNTYEHGGLPPGPIGNPGEISLRAALAPAQTDYLYFVANTQGGHFFSATLAEHNKNVNRYHRLLQGLPADPPPPPPAKKKAPAHAGKRSAKKR